MAMSIGIAGWPLRRSAVSEVADIFSDTPSNLVEIPKDLLDVVSLKALFEALIACKKAACFAGTTDFTNLAALSWEDYQRYLSVQVSCARFLRCAYWRVFLGAQDREQLRLSINRMNAFAETLKDLEVVVETHGGFESTEEGFELCLSESAMTFVVDIANIPEQALTKAIVAGHHRDRIAYFHIRNLNGYHEAEHLLELEEKMLDAHPGHTFLWEPKKISGSEAAEMFRRQIRLEPA
jgi:hypothetical protein